MVIDRQVPVHLDQDELQIAMDALKGAAAAYEELEAQHACAGHTAQKHVARAHAAGCRALRAKLQHYHQRAAALRLVTP